MHHRSLIVHRTSSLRRLRYWELALLPLMLSDTYGSGEWVHAPDGLSTREDFPSRIECDEPIA